MKSQGVKISCWASQAQRQPTLAQATLAKFGCDSGFSFN